jgi:hypothetical protein
MFTLSSFYNSKQWERFREYLIDKRTNKEDGLIYDEITGKPIINKYDIILHHTIVLTESNVNELDISLNEDLIQIVSHKTHNMIHGRFGSEGTRHVYLVYGSPGSGKSEYVKSIAGVHDMVLDLDNIYQCISINNRYENSKRLSRNVFQIRDLMLDMIKTRNGRFQNAYIIGGYPLEAERERIVNTIGAEEIFINKTIDECLMNVQERPEQYKKYVQEWFDSYNA